MITPKRTRRRKISQSQTTAVLGEKNKDQRNKKFQKKKIILILLF
jgi:hypothetical protein